MRLAHWLCVSLANDFVTLDENSADGGVRAAPALCLARQVQRAIHKVQTARSRSHKNRLEDTQRLRAASATQVPSPIRTVPSALASDQICHLLGGSRALRLLRTTAGKELLAFGGLTLPRRLE